MQLSDPFEVLKSDKPKKEKLNFQEWGGTFSCDTPGCRGWANIAKYFPAKRILAWECQEGHRSFIEDVYE